MPELLEPAAPVVYQLRVVLRGVSPLAAALPERSTPELRLSGGNTSAVLRRRARTPDAARSVPAVTGSDRWSGVASARGSATQASDADDPGCSRPPTRGGPTGGGARR